MYPKRRDANYSWYNAPIILFGFVYFMNWTHRHAIIIHEEIVNNYHHRQCKCNSVKSLIFKYVSLQVDRIVYHNLVPTTTDNQCYCLCICITCTTHVMPLYLLLLLFTYILYVILKERPTICMYLIIKLI